MPFESSAYPFLQSPATTQPAGEPSWVTVYAVTDTAPKLYKEWSKDSGPYPSTLYSGGQWYTIRPAAELTATQSTVFPAAVRQGMAR